MFSKKNRSRNKFYGKNVLITGGSSGIGLAIAKQFAGLGSHLFLIARDPEKLRRSARELQREHEARAVEIFAVDVTDESKIHEIIQSIGEQFGGIHTLILNAGIMVYGRFEEIEPEELREGMNVNYFGAVNCLKAALPYLKRAENGHIGMVSSVAGYVGLLGYSGYAPTKFALNGLAECLRMEFKTFNIGLTVAYPPDTQTPMLQYEHKVSLPETQAINRKASILQPQQVAAKFVQGMQKGKFELFCNRESRMIRILRHLGPSLFFRQLDGIVKQVRSELGKGT